jgi:hypothetical protein
MSAPHGATWRSGYATVCKTVYTSSILVVASNVFKYSGLDPKIYCHRIATETVASSFLFRASNISEGRLHDLSGACVGI